MKNKKQFIAGASCPSCDNIDTLVLFSHDQSISCVECDFTQTAAERDGKLSAENKQTNLKGNNTIQVVNLS